MGFCRRGKGGRKREERGIGVTAGSLFGQESGFCGETPTPATQNISKKKKKKRIRKNEWFYFSQSKKKKS